MPKFSAAVDTPSAAIHTYRAVIFDLFYTLINPLNPVFMVENEYAVLGMSREDFENRNAVDYAVRAGGGVRDPVEMIRHILRGLDFPDDLIRRAAAARLARIRRCLMGVEEKKLALLRRLRAAGIRTALVSNADIADIWYWKESPLASCFDETIFSYDVGILKPDPRIYALALERFGLPPAACLYVGDGGHRELRGAREAGLRTALTVEYITGIWPEKIPAIRPWADYVIENLEQTAEIVIPEKR
jgi:putative hydrolase of the HAD superfamily